MPTEEVFTAPLRDGIDGVVYAALPLVHNGNIIENFHFVIKDGKIVEAHAEKGEDILFGREPIALRVDPLADRRSRRGQREAARATVAEFVQKWLMTQTDWKPHAGQKVEVRCLLDITEIRRDEIASVRRVDPRRMKWFFPVFGGCGFFGYYGHFLDLRRFERVKLYASEWKNFVEITDIYEDRLYVSCSDAGRLVEELMPPGGNRPAEDDEEEEQAQ